MGRSLSRDPSRGYYATSKPLRIASVNVAQADTTDKTLTAAQYEFPILRATGSPGGNFNWILPNLLDSTFIIHNTTANDLTAKKSGGTGVVIAAGAKAWIIHNGTDYVTVL